MPFQDRDVERELEVRLERLKNIIAQRREELGLPPESKEENLKDNLSGWEPVEQQDVNYENSQLQQSINLNVSESVRTDSSAEWEPIVKQETETDWAKKKKKAIRDIEIARGGGEVIDE